MHTLSGSVYASGCGGEAGAQRVGPPREQKLVGLCRISVLEMKSKVRFVENHPNLYVASDCVTAPSA